MAVAERVTQAVLVDGLAVAFETATGGRMSAERRAVLWALPVDGLREVVRRTRGDGSILVAVLLAVAGECGDGQRGSWAAG